MGRQESRSRIVVFIDWQNIQNRSFDDSQPNIDPELLRKYIERYGEVLNIYVYLTVVEDPALGAKQGLSPLAAELKRHKFIVREKAVELKNAPFRGMPESFVRSSGVMDVELALDVAEVIHQAQEKVDKIILFSGSKSFIPLLRYIKEHGTPDKSIDTMVIARTFGRSEELCGLADAFFQFELTLPYITRQD